MRAVNTESLSDQEMSADEDVGLVDFLIVLAKRKKLIAGITIAATIAGAAASLILPVTYQASAKILPPQQSQSSAASMLAQLGGAAGLAAGMAGIKNPSDLYIGMLKSRTVADRLIDSFNLKAAYETESTEKARKKLEVNTSISAGKDGLINVDVQDSDKKRVAKLANAYVDELTRLTRTLAVTEASQRRIFFERQLEQSKNNLATAEISLKRGLDSRGVISVDVESRAIVETIGRLRAQVSAKEIELNSMRPFITESNPAYQKTVETLNSLRAELAKLENGRSSNNDDTPVAKGSNGFENIKLLRDVKYYQMLYELLAKQYEIARLDEAKDPAIIQILDAATEPEQKFKPKRSVIVMLSALGGLIAAILLALGLEARQRALRLPTGAIKWNELKKYLSFK